MQHCCLVPASYMGKWDNIVLLSNVFVSYSKEIKKLGYEIHQLFCYSVLYKIILYWNYL